MNVNSDSGNVNTDSGKSLKSVHLQPESLFTLNQNGCSRSSGMGVQDEPEYAFESCILRDYLSELVYNFSRSGELKDQKKEITTAGVKWTPKFGQVPKL